MKYSVKTKLDVEANKRDGFKCVQCGKETGIETHHIIPELEELDNLITLCHGCHKEKHDMAGCFKKGFDPKRNTKQIFKKGHTQGAWCRDQGYYFNRWEGRFKPVKSNI